MGNLKVLEEENVDVASISQVYENLDKMLE
jgi:hypothetical protein